MKGKIEIPEKELKFELEDIALYKFRIVRKRPDFDLPDVMVTEGVGEPITLITSNMPTRLREEIVAHIEQFCNIS